MAETQAEIDLKKKHGLGSHVRVAVNGARPKRVPTPPATGQANAPRGFGDVIANWTKAVGIKPCEGCRRRQAALNRAFPFRKKR